MTKRRPPCGHTFDDVTCAERRPHLCVPRANHAQAFFEEILVHTKGMWARQPFKLADWQRDEIIRPLFGMTLYDEQWQRWVRQYAAAWVEIAKKNSKSEMAAGIALKLLCADDEEGGEIYGAAIDREQAGLVFNVAKRMVELSPTLSQRLQVIDSAKRIVDPSTSSFYTVIAADAFGNYGVNPSGAIVDEVIVQRDGELIDTLRKGTATRAQPLVVMLTTAGNDPESFAFDEHLYCERVARGEVKDPRRFVFMRNTPRDADWRDEANWYHANPALGDFLNINVLRDEAREATLNLGKQNLFRQFRLNQWVRNVVRWLDLDLWDANAGMVVEEGLADRPCFGGLDLAATSDFVAWVLVFPPALEDGSDGVQVLARFWLPQAAVDRRSSMRDQLQQWVLDGWLQVTDGDVIDEDAIFEQINRDAQAFDIREAGYDRWAARQLVRRLEEQGLACEGVPQTHMALNGPTIEIERLLGLHLLHHGGNPILRWMADQVSTSTDAEGRRKPDRKKSKEKIDGIVALADAIHRQLAQEEVGAIAFLAG